MLQTIKISGHVDADGILKLEIPVGFANQEVEGVLVMQQPTMFAREAHGWPIGFFRRLMRWVAMYCLNDQTRASLKYGTQSIDG